MIDPFPAEDFDDWTKDYDQAVANTENFPFTGYKQVLDQVAYLADPQPDMQVLDLGIGTGNLALRLAASGCEIWGTDFSAAMLEKARLKLPEAHLFQADLRGTWPVTLNRRFDRIVSAYVFHHFELRKKVKIIGPLVRKRLNPTGSLIIADIAFQNRRALEDIKRAASDEWEDEYYWLADESLPALKQAGLKVEYLQVSFCAGIFSIT
jgi:putative AdoMet-dependent methyltransferase